MTRKILNNLVVILALSVIGLPAAYAQDKGQADEEKATKAGAHGKKQPRRLKRGQAEKKREKIRGKDLKARKLRGEGDAPEQSGKKLRRKRELSKPVPSKPIRRDIRRERIKKLRSGSAKRSAMAPRGKAVRAMVTQELQKHAKRIARINRLKDISKENDNEKLRERADILLKKESMRHRRKLSKLKSGKAKPAKSKQLRRLDISKTNLETAESKRPDLKQ